MKEEYVTEDGATAKIHWDKKWVIIFTKGEELYHNSLLTFDDLSDLYHHIFHTDRSA